MAKQTDRFIAGPDGSKSIKKDDPVTPEETARVEKLWKKITGHKIK